MTYGQDGVAVHKDSTYSHSGNSHCDVFERTLVSLGAGAAHLRLALARAPLSAYREASHTVYSTAGWSHSAYVVAQEVIYARCQSGWCKKSRGVTCADVACKYPVEEREGSVRLSCEIEEVEDLRCTLDGLEDDDSGCESGLVTPSDVSDDAADGVDGLH
ncbi:hypothetical protein DEU56DRAFT_202558 [Suillus clintonianus]|uniref:uncharacterized protein n=1 Tax=Suillus clintonianus TaxID=1904413 RepID=UPI001B85FCD0|nr:uncharacterized protein DEU56DRAFT_202558 [Suillus clintonianus]KAG2112406.1 hypothetical protein DEU56DRAFT_202558 [Suillus clintonianus]